LKFQILNLKNSKSLILVYFTSSIDTDYCLCICQSTWNKQFTPNSILPSVIAVCGRSSQWLEWQRKISPYLGQLRLFPRKQEIVYNMMYKTKNALRIAAHCSVWIIIFSGHFMILLHNLVDFALGGKKSIFIRNICLRSSYLHKAWYRTRTRIHDSECQKL
jgi:hypothetical protein